jgi:hypothetical protein
MVDGRMREDRYRAINRLLEGADSGGDARPLTEGRMLELAPPEMRVRLQQLLQRDGIIDARNINAWRRSLERR